MLSTPEKHWRNLFPLGAGLLVLTAEAFLQRATEARWIYLIVMITWVSMLLFILQKDKKKDKNTVALMLLALDAGIGIFLLASGIFAAAGFPEAAAVLQGTLEKCTPVLVAWWAVVYQRQPRRLIVYLLLIYLEILLFSINLHGWAAMEFLLLITLEALAVRFALRTLRALTANLDMLEQGADETLDPITGFVLPATFEAELALVAALADRQHSTFSLLAWEIDGYHDYINQFGSAAGERLLRLVALSIGDSLRISDTIGRWDGERFLMILPDTTAVEAGRVKDKIRQRVALIEAIDKGPVTLRFAIVEHSPGGDPLLVVERAERALADTLDTATRPA